MVVPMPHCVDCEALLDQLATTEPHAAMQGAAVYTAHAAVLERYSCSVCGSVWNRWTARKTDYRWTRLIAAEQTGT